MIIRYQTIRQQRLANSSLILILGLISDDSLELLTLLQTPVPQMRLI